MNPSHTWFCHNSIQSPFNSSTYLDYCSKKNAGMWWQRGQDNFPFFPHWSSGGYVQERWKHGGVFPALLGLHWCEEELWDFWLRDYIHCAAGLMTSHTQPYTHTYGYAQPVEHKLQGEASGGDSEAGWNDKRRRWLWLFSAPSFFFESIMIPSFLFIWSTVKTVGIQKQTQWRMWLKSQASKATFWFSTLHH